MLRYAYTASLDTNGQYLVTFADLPEAAAVVDAPEDAAVEGLDGLLCAIEAYIDDRRAVPLSDAAAGDGVVELPALETAKVLLHNEMVAQGVRKAEMARRLGVHMPQVDRLLDLRHNTKIDFIDRAAAMLGRRIDLKLA